jgi:hypothetical protein
MLPWFCGLQSDLETLEVVESGTFSELSVAHRDMVAARLSPSGLPNRYGAIPFAFPAAVELKALERYRTRWSVNVTTSLR